MPDRKRLIQEIEEIKAVLKTLDPNSRAYRKLDKELADLEALLSEGAAIARGQEGGVERIHGNTMLAGDSSTDAPLPKKKKKKRNR